MRDFLASAAGLKSTQTDDIGDNDGVFFRNIPDNTIRCIILSTEWRDV